MLPSDGHVHSEWSWDALAGSMEGTCARAIEVGLPAVAFTEHLDHTVWADEGGTAVTFGSDAHEPAELARNFREVAAMAEAHGFGPGPTPHEPWARAR
jgi:histidinol phosphatase-like PHP family hydrolase